MISSSNAGRRLPAEHALGLGGIAEQQVHLGRAEELGVDDDMVLVLQVHAFERDAAHFAHRRSHAGGDHIVVGLVLLQHQPHRFDIVAGVSPVALGVDVAQPQLRLLARA